MSNVKTGQRFFRAKVVPVLHRTWPRTVNAAISERIRIAKQFRFRQVLASGHAYDEEAHFRPAQRMSFR